MPLFYIRVRNALLLLGGILLTSLLGLLLAFGDDTPGYHGVLTVAMLTVGIVVAVSAAVVHTTGKRWQDGLLTGKVLMEWTVPAPLMLAERLRHINTLLKSLLRPSGREFLTILSVFVLLVIVWHRGAIFHPERWMPEWLLRPALLFVLVYALIVACLLWQQQLLKRQLAAGMRVGDVMVRLYSFGLDRGDAQLMWYANDLFCLSKVVWLDSGLPGWVSVELQFRLGSFSMLVPAAEQDAVDALLNERIYRS